MKKRQLSRLSAMFLAILLGSYACSATMTTHTPNSDNPADGDENSLDGDDPNLDGDDPSLDGDDPITPPESLTYPVVDTGQVTCYADGPGIVCPDAGEEFFGQDAQYDGFTPRYRDNGDGTVSDLVTGLMWQQNPGDKQQYADAIAGVNGFTLAGYDDWRVPTIKELYSLILFSGRDVDPMAEFSDDMQPFIDDDTFAFSYGDTGTGDRVIDSQWVTSSIYTDTVMNDQECFFGVNFADGRIKCYPTSNKTYFAIYVRGNSQYGANSFSNNGDGTVTDTATGLMWMKDDSGDTLNWAEALDFCESLTLAGHDDWTLPDAKELQSLVDYSRSPGHTGSPAIDPLFSCTGITNEADQPDFGHYWSRTTHVNPQGGADAAYVSFGRAMGYMNGHWMDVHGAGAQRSDPKAGDPSDMELGQGPQGDARRIYNFVRCVRDSQAFNADPAGNDSIGNDPIMDGDDPPADGDQPQGPVSCTTQSDCDQPNACPQEARLGCICAETPQGGMCVPSCNTDSDCPDPPEVMLVCGPDGLCVPDGGPMR